MSSPGSFDATSDSDLADAVYRLTHGGLPYNPEVHTALIKGKRFRYCIKCIRPHVYLHCDGYTEIEYQQCSSHTEPRVATWTPSNIYDWNRNTQNNPERVIELDTDHYDEIREAVGTEKLAVLLSNSIPETELIYKSYVDEMGKTARANIANAVEEMMRARQVHGSGCLHSENPEVVVCSSARKDKGGPPALATGLFFKRCNGVFKNVKGEVLSRGVEGETLPEASEGKNGEAKVDLL